MSNQKNQNQNPQNDRNQNENDRNLNENQQRTAGRNEEQNTPLETQGGGGARGYDVDREQNEVNREREELNTQTSPDRTGKEGMDSPGRQSDEQR